jgi:hypothetical protein
MRYFIYFFVFYRVSSKRCQVWRVEKVKAPVLMEFLLHSAIDMRVCQSIDYPPMKGHCIIWVLFP